MNKIVYDQFEIEFEKDEIALEFDASKSDWTFITKHTPLVKKHTVVYFLLHALSFRFIRYLLTNTMGLFIHLIVCSTYLGVEGRGSLMC